MCWRRNTATRRFRHKKPPINEGVGAEMHWLIHDMHRELKSRGYPGGENNPVILKCDGESSIIAVRDRLARYHGGQVTPEDIHQGRRSAMVQWRRLAKQSED